MSDLATVPRDRELPRYLQIAAELRAQILAGKFTGSGQFPTESELCQHYSISRFTVREALRRLQGEGLIARRRGSGTTVQPAAARGGTLHQPLSNVGEILQYARDTHVTYVRGSDCTVPAKVAEQIAEDTAGHWLCFTGVRRQLGDDRPLAATDAYFHPRIAAAAERLDLDAGTLFGQIEAFSGVAIGKVTQDIQAVIANAPIAAALELKRGAAVLQILRCYYDTKGALFEISVSHHPGDRFAYSMHIDVDS